MLILTRRPGESINVGNDIIVHLLDVRGSQARIGIEAPKDVNITRPDAKVQYPRVPE